jgi:hypothetical protein
MEKLLKNTLKILCVATPRAGCLHRGRCLERIFFGKAYAIGQDMLRKGEIFNGYDLQER